MDYMKLFEQMNNFEHAKKAKLTIPINPYKLLPSTFCASLVTDLKRIKLVYNDKNLVATKATLTGITDPQLGAAAKIAFSMPRSSLLTVIAAKNPRYASLTPLLMLAHKEKDKIMYEQWDKEDEFIKYALGPYLACLVQDEISKVKLTNIEATRRHYIGEGKPLTGYTGKMTEVPSDKVGLVFRLPGSKAYSKMILQTWIAHASLRIPNVMILDPWNWDNVPEPFDVETKVEVVPTTLGDNLPW